MTSTEMVTTEQHLPSNPFAKGPGHAGGNIGAIAIESERAIAEAQGQLVIAKKFPRSMAGAMSEFMDACKNSDFAETAFYSVPNRGSGPSIRFAEEVARCYGNFDYGHRELSRVNGTKDVPGKSEVEVYAWDKEKNNYSRRQIPVIHSVDTKYGPKILTDQTDIDNRVANVASKQMRGRILALVPKHIVAAGIAECKRTLAGGNDKPISERIAAMTIAFGKYGVTPKMLDKHLGHQVDNTTIDELADLTGIFNAIKDGGKPSEFFPADGTEEGEKPKSGAAVAIEKAAEKKSTTTKVASKTTESTSKNVKETGLKSGDKAATEPNPASQDLADKEPPKETPASPASVGTSEPPAEEGEVF